MRIGIGYDAHRLTGERPFILGGVEIPFEQGLEGWSDADVVVHAIIDALLGAAALGDIGIHFPANDPAYEGISSIVLLGHTRNLLNAALEGKLDKVKYRKDKLFGFEVPLSCPGVPEDVLEPSNSWGDKDDYWKKYDALAARYIENFKKYGDGCPAEVTAAGPKRLKK